MAHTEEYKVSGEDIMKKIKNLINEGNIRRITIKNKEGKEIAQFPLTVGVVGTVLLPVMAAIGTIVALASECTITVEKEDERDQTSEDVKEVLDEEPEEKTTTEEKTPEKENK